MSQSFSRSVEGPLLGVVAHGDYGVFRGRRCRLGNARDDEPAVPGGDFPRKALAVFQSQMKDVGRLDGSDGIPLDCDLADKFGFQEKGFYVARGDLSGKPVTILQSDLITEYCRSEKEKDWQTQKATTHLRPPSQGAVLVVRVSLYAGVRKVTLHCK